MLLTGTRRLPYGDPAKHHKRRPKRVRNMTHNEFNHLRNSINALSPEQLRQLRDDLDNKLASPPADHPALTAEEQAEQELQRRLVEAGVLSEIKPPRSLAPAGERFTPVPIKGEPLSETVIRERR
jgi:hypothetical protein